MVGYHVYEEDSHHTTARPASWGHLPNGGTVANLEAMWAARYMYASLHSASVVPYPTISVPFNFIDFLIQ